MTKKILIADDEEEIVDLLRFALEREGYQVLSTGSGSALPAMVKKEQPDLLILDVLLPGLDGYSLQLQFAQDEATRHTPVVVITALPAARSLFDKFPQVKGFLNKPFAPDVFLAKVKEVLRA